MERKTHLQKKKLSDMLGSQWSKDELELFYGAYRKYGKDWRKVCLCPSRQNRNKNMHLI
jgi:hypothetical protein